MALLRLESKRGKLANEVSAEMHHSSLRSTASTYNTWHIHKEASFERQEDLSLRCVAKPTKKPERSGAFARGCSTQRHQAASDHNVEACCPYHFGVRARIACNMGEGARCYWRHCMFWCPRQRYQRILRCLLLATCAYNRSIIRTF